MARKNIKSSNNKLQVAVNTRLLLAHRMEGVARYIYETSKSMVLAHPETQFHFLFDRPFDPQFVFADNVTAHVIGLPSRHPLLWYLWFEKSLPSFFKKHNIDVFYSGDMYMSLRAKVPTLMVSHDLNYLHYPEGLRSSHLRFYQRYMPLYHKAADHIITVSDATKYDVIKQYKIDSDKISVAYNSVPGGFSILDSQVIRSIRSKYSDGSPYFVYVGSLHPRKNIANLLRAYDRFRSMSGHGHKIKLVIYGRKAWKTKDIYSVYERLKYKDDIVFLSNSDVSVSSIMGGAIALCYVSLFEGFGIPILEAYKSGIPVITSDVSSMPEVAGDGAILVDPKNVEMIASAMNSIVKDESLSKKLITAGQKQLSHFSWKASSQIIYEKLEQLSGGA